VNRPVFVFINPHSCAAFGLSPGTSAMVGAWLITEAGELHVLADGTVTLRPSPLPWSRPSVAAIPSMVLR
jgi:hypothetical protein